MSLTHRNRLVAAARLGLFMIAQSAAVQAEDFYSSTAIFTPPEALPIVDVPLNRALARNREEARERLVTVVATPDGQIERQAPTRRQVGELMSLIEAEWWARSGSGEAATRRKVERGKAPAGARSALEEADLLRGDLMAPETVIGQDSRQQIINTTEYPYRVVGRISMGGGIASCSGTLIGPRHVLTAGHCVYDIATDQWYDGIDFSPGQEGPNRPFDTLGVVAVLALDGWVTRHEREFDIAMLILDRNIGEETGWMGFAAEELAPQAEVIINGYPGDKPEGTMWYAFCPVEMTLPQRLYYGCDTFGGMSGSGVHAPTENDIVVYGVHVNGVDGTGLNSATRINQALFEVLLRWKETN